MVEVYSALIFYLLTRIVIALSSQQTGCPLTSYSFKRSAELIKAFLTTHIAQFLDHTKTYFASFLHNLVDAVSAVGLKDKHLTCPEKTGHIAKERGVNKCHISDSFLASLHEHRDLYLYPVASDSRNESTGEPL